MRPLEAALGAACLLLALGGWRSRPLLGIGVLLLVAHAAIEGVRLQAVPLYASLLAALLAGWIPLPLWVKAAPMLLSTAIGLAACYAIPVFRLPEPTGPLPIGTRIVELTDTARRETHAANGEPRRLLAQIWYPATGCDGPRSLYRDPRALLSKSAHHRLVRTHSCIDAPVRSAGGPWPLILFSHSSGGYKTQNTYLVEDLVSYGYTVVSLDHPYVASRTPLASGVIHSRPDLWLNLGSRAALADSIPRFEATIATHVRDLQFALAWLEREAPRPLRQAIDFTRIAAIGHSFGGAIAAELCRTDPRVLAGVNLDGWMSAGFRASGVPRPFLFVIEDDPLWAANEGPYPDNEDGLSREGTLDYHNGIRRSLAQHGGYLLRIFGAVHGDFADMSLYLRFPGGKPDATRRRIHELTRIAVRAMMDRFLRGAEPGFLSTSRTTNEYQLQVAPPPRRD